MLKSTFIAFIVSVSIAMAHADSPTKKVLMVLTGATHLDIKDGEKYETGYWLEEFSVPYQIFEKKGYRITLVTPNGNRPTVDHGSAGTGPDGKPLYWPSVAELNDALAVKKRVLDEGPIRSLGKIPNFELETYDAVFFPGGHGPMQDLLRNRDVARVLTYFHQSKKPTVLVCHAPAVLTSTSAAGFLYKGYKVTAFTDAEEAQTPVGPKMKTTPQKELEQAGAIFVQAQPWESFVVEDRELITGQNPASSKAIAEALVKRLR